MSNEEEIKEFANDLSIESDDVALTNKDGIEHAFHIQQARNLIKKGYRKHPAQGLVELDEEALYDLLFQKGITVCRFKTNELDMLVKKICSKFGTRSVSEEEINKCLFKCGLKLSILRKECAKSILKLIGGKN